MKQQMSRCMGCMAPLEPGVASCPACSYDNSIDNPPGCLAAGTLLADRYLVGRMERQSGLITAYLGYDTKKNSRVYVEEFMPKPFVRRGEDGATLLVSPEHQPRYKTLLSDMADRWKRLAGITNKALPRIRELLQLHNTVYCVSSYHHTVPLEEYLEQRGVLEWSEARTLMMPVFSLVSQIHNLGLVHCGISPDNIVVGSRGQLRLTGFALPELRTAGTDLPSELYSGYSAPEQYSKSQWQGEWTDIYALGAVLYRALVGEDPVAAPRRMKLDPLLAVAVQKPDVPANVSDAIMKAMEMDKKRRFVSVDQFTAALLEEAGSNTAVFRPAQEKAVQPVPQPAAQEGPSWMRIGLVASVVVNLVLLLAMATGNNFLYNPPEPPPEPEPPPVMEYDLVGLYYPSVRALDKSFGAITLRPEYLFREDVPQGVIYEQSVEVGDVLPTDNNVTVWVSRGSRFFLMPNLEGCSERYAIMLLGELGLEWGEILQSTDITVPVGTVVCSVPPGTKMESGDKVILTVRVEGDPTQPPEEEG